MFEQSLETFNYVPVYHHKCKNGKTATYFQKFVFVRKIVKINHNIKIFSINTGL